MLAKEELISLLQRCLEILQQSKSKKIKSALSQLTELLAKFKQCDGKLSKSRQSFVFSVKIPPHANFFVFFYFATLCLTAAAEAAPAQDDTVTSPVRNLQKKTDLFQLQKVFFLLLCQIIRFKSPL